jgi:hypothetical protein
MNFFCRLLGHTWVPKFDSPRTRWNTGESAQELIGTPGGAPRLYEECARCHQQKEVPTPDPSQRAR